MTVNRKVTGKAASVPAGVAMGIISASLITLAGAAVTALLIDKEILQWAHISYAVLITVVCSAWVGATVSYVKIKRRKVVMCLTTGIFYFCILLCFTALFFGGQYSGVGETALLIFCGSVLGIFTKCEKQDKRKVWGSGMRYR